MLVVALVVALMPLVDPARGLTVLFVLILVLTIAAATQDMAIDAYTVALVRREEQGPANGVRASAYRVALVLIGSGMVALAHFLPWGLLFAAVAVVFAGLGLLVQRVPRLDVPAEARQRWLRPFLAWIGTWRAVPLVAFVLTYKLGEFAIGPMVKPFWVDRGASLLEIGLVPTALGIVLSIAGALAGGAFMQRYGTLTALWALGLPQAVSNLAYAAVALWSLPRPALYAASMIDSFAGGLGTAAFLGFFLAVCDPRARHPPVRVPVVPLLVHRPARRRGERDRRRAVGVWAVLRDHVPRVPAGPLSRAAGRVLDSGATRAPARLVSARAGELLAVGFEGTALPEAVAALAAESGLGGIVLFRRNCPDLDAVLALTAAARRLGPDVLVLVDHEGGRVHRLPLPFTHFPPAATIGRAGDPGLAAAVARAMARELRAAGFDSGLRRCWTS